MNYKTSQSLFEKAQHFIPGGVNSPVRAFKGVGGTPVFIKTAKGAYLYDEDGNQYIDYINSWGPMILGHASEPVTKALEEQLKHSLSYGAPTRLEVEMAELICRMTGIESLRMVNSGTEACMSAVRLARAYTGKNKIIKFEGCYHGHADSLLVSAGSGVATLNIQAVPGITASTADDTLTAEYNNIGSVEAIVKRSPGEIAAIIIEPVAGNMGCVPPVNDFLQQLRILCDRNNILLIFDEVMTGFRLSAGGAQALYKVRPDIVTYGKVIGGGLPVGAYGGRKEIMQWIAPAGKVYQAGTLSGNPLAMRAGYTTLKILHDNSEIYTELNNTTERLKTGLQKIFEAAGIPVCINSAGSMISVFFSNEKITDYQSANAADKELFKKYFHFCLDSGIYLPPSALESWFISTAISGKELDHTLTVTQEFTKRV